MGDNGGATFPAAQSFVRCHRARLRHRDRARQPPRGRNGGERHSGRAGPPQPRHPSGPFRTIPMHQIFPQSSESSDSSSTHILRMSPWSEPTFEPQPWYIPGWRERSVASGSIDRLDADFTGPRQPAGRLSPDTAGKVSSFSLKEGLQEQRGQPGVHYPAVRGVGSSTSPSRDGLMFITMGSWLPTISARAG